jgi:hypothetical protein
MRAFFLSSFAFLAPTEGKIVDESTSMVMKSEHEKK